MMRAFMRPAALAAAILSAAAVHAAPMLETVSNRADLVSGGDVLVRVRPVGEGQGTLSVNGAPLSGALRPAPNKDGYLALVTGLKNGANTLTYAAGGRTATLDVTNHPIGGPIFSGPHLLPWTCTTQNHGLGPAVDADCNAPTAYTYFYKKQGTTDFLPYDPARPPPAAEIASATTDQGRTVPYIVRVETGTLNRTLYKITVLFEPGKPWTPFEPQAAWNGKLLYLFGAGAQTQYTQGVLVNTFDDPGLSRGFATAAAVMTTEGQNANSKLNAEALMMVKERFAESYGAIRYTIGSGCSGGAIQQHSIADQYPGLLDGLLPVCSYPDLWSLAVNSHDCQLLSTYFVYTAGALWTNPAHRTAVLGLNSEQECPGQDGPAAFGGRWFPVTNPSCMLPGEARFNPFTNPAGVRCNLRGYYVNQLGKRADGLVNQVFDNVGVMYGLKAVEAGTISPEQFVDLNEKVGGLDPDGGFSAQRTRADAEGLARMYETGLITYGRELGKAPIIDARTDDNHEMHNNSEWIFTRNRLRRTNGSAGLHVQWWEASTTPNPVGNVSRPSAPYALKSLLLMDQWLAAVEADKSEAPREAKLAKARPAEARDRCVVGGQEHDWTKGSVCDQQFTYTGLTRMVAGGPDTNDVLKCQLKPLNRAEIKATFSDAQWARLQKTFGDGVCDYSKPGVAQVPPKAAWLTFAGGPGGAPLPAAPVAREQ